MTERQLSCIKLVLFSLTFVSNRFNHKLLEINKMIEHLKLEDTLIATFRPVLRLKVKSWNQNPLCKWM